MTTAEQYIQEVQRLIATVKDTQADAIEAAAALCALMVYMLFFKKYKEATKLTADKK